MAFPPRTGRPGKSNFASMVTQRPTKRPTKRGGRK